MFPSVRTDMIAMQLLTYIYTETMRSQLDALPKIVRENTAIFLVIMRKNRQNGKIFQKACKMIKECIKYI